jgi:hypothetical protein
MTRLAVWFVVLFIPLAASADEPARPEEEPKLVPVAKVSILDLRLSLGAAVRMQDENKWGGALDFDLLGRFELGHTGLGLLPEVGYSTFVTDPYHDHYGVAGLGFGFLGEGYAFAIVPAFVLGGTMDDEKKHHLGLGYRTTLLAEIPRIIGLHVTHQVVAFDGEVLHEFRFMLSFHLHILEIFTLCS